MPLKTRPLKIRANFKKMWKPDVEEGLRDNLDDVLKVCAVQDNAQTKAVILKLFD